MATENTKTAAKDSTTESVTNNAPADPLAVPRPTLRRTSDEGDANVGWTIQSSEPFEDKAAVPGTVVTKAELPDPEVQLAAGINPEAQTAGLVVAEDEAERDAIRLGEKAV